MFGWKENRGARENALAAFSMGSLTSFWRQRREAESKGVDDVPVRFICFCVQNNGRLMLICPGRIESCVKYTEVAYDLFHSGFDMMIIDHRNQGRSDRLLSDTHRGHVVNFSDYVNDLATLQQQQVVPGHWRKRLILAHSMGETIATFFLQCYQAHCDVVALCAPMFGIIIRLPDWMVCCIPDWVEDHQHVYEECAIDTGRWRALPLVVNVLTHGRQHYRHDLRFYADEPRLQVGGPTWYWVREDMLADDEVLTNIGEDTAPALLLQIEEKRVADNLMHDHYCELRAAADRPHEGGKPLVIEGTYHEILLEKDATHSVALNAIAEFFNRHT